MRADPNRLGGLPNQRALNGQGSAAGSVETIAGWQVGREPEGEKLIDIGVYWRILLKHKFIVLCAVLSALIIGTSLTLLMAPKYTAAATLQIDREAARVFDAEEVSSGESMIQGEEFFQTQYGLLRSRSLTQRVVDSLGLATSDTFLEAMGVTPPEEGSATQRQANRQELVIAIIQENLTVSPVRGSRLVEVRFRSPDPALSARIVNAFTENFIQSNLDRKFESSSYAREFLEERIAQTKAALEDAERRLVQYAQEEQIINLNDSSVEPGQNQSLASNNLQALNTALAESRASRTVAEEKWRQASGGSLSTLGQVLDNPTIQRLTEERARVQSEYQQKLALYRPEFPEMQQLDARIQELTAQINTLSTQVRSSVQREYLTALNQERSLQAQVDGLKGDVLDLRNRSIQYNILQRELDTSRTLYDGLLQRYKEVGVTGGLTTNNVSIIDAAEPPTEPSEPILPVNILVSALLGLVLGVTIAFVMEALDETLATPEDIESKLQLPALGVIPLLDKGTPPKAALTDIRSPFSEAYYSLRTALQFSTPHGAPESLLVTSSRPAEGKSTTAYAIALSLARIGKRVLLIDGDLRNPSMHRVVGVDNPQGMSNLLSGSAKLADVTQKVGEERLDFISSGPLPPNPAELWGSDQLAHALEEARELYDHVVIDGPPVLGFADAPLLAAAVGGTVFVLESRGTRRAQARGALRRLQIGSAHIIGGVLTKFNTKTSQYGTYDYSYDYNYGGRSDQETTEKTGGKGKR